MEPQTELLLRELPAGPLGRVVIINPPGGALVQRVATHAERVTAFPREWPLSCTLSGLAVRAAPHLSVSEAVLPDTSLHGTADLALALVPKGREHARAVLVAALGCLRDRGTLLVAGPNRGGVHTAQTDAETLGSAVEHLASAHAHRVFRVRRTTTPLPPADWQSPWLPRPLHVTLAGTDYTVTTQPGIFSWDRLDAGTAFLIDTLLAQPPGPVGRVLDAGCGCGILGLFAQRQFAPAAVTWCDTDLLAVACTRATVGTRHVVPADLTEPPLAALTGFDLILCNPPFHAGHRKDTGFVDAFARQVPAMLAPGGRLVVVANRFLPYQDVLAAHLARVRRLAADGRFQVLQAVRRSA